MPLLRDNFGYLKGGDSSMLSVYTASLAGLDCYLSKGSRLTFIANEQAGVLSAEDLITSTPNERPVTRSATQAAAAHAEPAALPDSRSPSSVAQY